MEGETAAPAKVNMTELYTALAKAQGAFPTIPKDKTVKVTMKSGGTYTFAYAPLDTILAAVRKPLADNGLGIIQTIEDNHVITILTHASGAEMRLAPVKILQTESGPQALGSALTYSRRYSVTLALNISADDDDDGNGAAGNMAEKQTKAAGKQQQADKSSTQQPSADPKDVEHVERVKTALKALYGDDKQTALNKVEELTSFIPKGKTEADRVKGVRNFATLTGQRLTILCGNLEKMVKAQTEKEPATCNGCGAILNKAGVCPSCADTDDIPF